MTLLAAYLKGWLKFLFVYMFLGYIAVLILLFVLAWSIQLQYDCSYLAALESIAQLNDVSFFLVFRDRLSAALPLSAALDIAFEGSGVFSIFQGFGDFFAGAANTLTGAISGETDMKTLFAGLFPDLTKIVISLFIMYLFEPLKKIFGALRGISVFLACIAAEIWWTVMSYQLASTLTAWIDKFTASRSINRLTAYWCVFLFFVILRALCCAIEHKTDVFPFFLEILLDCVGGLLRSVLVWLLCAYCTTLLMFLTVFFLFLIYVLLADLIKVFLLKKSFPGFNHSLFIKNTLWGKLFSRH